MQKTRIVIVIGPPGSGKGTQCELLANQTGMIHVSTGDMCREMVALGTENGKKIAPYLKANQFVPDALIVGVLRERIQRPDAQSHGILLDGFPRTIHQAKMIASSTDINVERVILLQLPDDSCADRISFRRVDPITSKVYNTKYVPPPNDIPDIVNRLVKRETDVSEDVIKTRILTYNANVGPVLQQFKGKIQVVNGNQSIEAVHASFVKTLSEQPTPVVEEVTEVKKTTTTQKPQVTTGQCVVCMSEPANFLVIPCGHQCGCEGCLTHLKGKADKCPICRTKISGIVRVYNSGIIDADSEIIEEKIIETVVEKVVVLQAPSVTAHDDGGWGAEEAKVEHESRVTNYEKSVSDSIKVSVAPCKDINADAATVDVAVNIQVPDIDTRIPVDVCCVIDISGSMGEEAKFQDPNDEKKMISPGLSILDVVKHAVKTIIHTLTDQDRLALVAFDSVATTPFSLSEMNGGGRDQAVLALEKLMPDASTNIWAGLFQGLEAIRNATTVSTNASVPRKKFILLFTDGQPVERPPNGEDMALKSYFENHPGFACQVSTFGFGYSLKSDILLNIANRGNGIFAFIPDAKIVGTCFVNAVANACSTLSQNSKVHLTPKGGAAFGGDVCGNVPFEKTSWGYVVKLGPLQHGQNRDIVVPMKIPSSGHTYSPEDYLEVTLEYESTSGAEPHKITVGGSARIQTLDSIAAGHRNRVVSDVYKVIDECTAGRGKNAIQILQTLTTVLQNGNPESPQLLQSLVNFIQTTANSLTSSSSSSSNSSTQTETQKPQAPVDERVKGLHSDVAGRISKSVSTAERFKRWGQHYLRAIVRAHQLQVCTNFMDAGLQVYGGSSFKKLEQAGGRVFTTLPLKKRADYEIHRKRGAPTTAAARTTTYTAPASTTTTTTSTTAAAPAPAAPAEDNSYLFAGSGGGCFDASCVVKIVRQNATGGQEEITAKISEVKKGDVVSVANKNGELDVATVKCLVKILRNSESDNLVEFQKTGLKITPTHPIRVNGTFYKPKDLLGKNEVTTCNSTTNYVYNLVLDRTHVLLHVNDMECTTFGHEFSDSVAWHPFYASREVVDAVESLPGYSYGQVETAVSLKSVLRKVGGRF